MDGYGTEDGENMVSPKPKVLSTIYSYPRMKHSSRGRAEFVSSAVDVENKLIFLFWGRVCSTLFISWIRKKGK